MQNYLGELRVRAVRDSLRTISYFIQGIGARLQLDDNTLFEVEVSVEEASTNIITHAYEGITPPGDIHLSAELIGNSLRITLTDWGKAYDPAVVKPFDINAPVEERIQGGMGVHFINKLMDGVERIIPEGPGDPNVFTLVKRVRRSRLRTPLQRRESEELKALQTVYAGMVSGINLDDLLVLIVNKLVETIGADRGTLYLHDEATGELTSKVLMEEPGILREIRLKVGEGIAGHVAATGETLNILDAHRSPFFNPEIDKVTGYTTRSILTVPMRNPQKKIIGVVQLLNKVGGSFNKRDERLLAAMATQAAISIENARLYERELERQLLLRDLETAYNIQQSFLPERLPTMPGWDIEAFWEPVFSVAGDFYDFFSLDDGRQAVAIADVSGKGIPAALFMALTVTVLRFGMSLNLPPSEVINRTNRLIIHTQRSRMFATIFLLYLNPGSGEMVYASAGHNPPLLYRAATGDCEWLYTEGTAVGVFTMAVYSEAALNLEVGDVLLLYTDGITEIINALEEEYGEDRLQTFLQENAQLSAEEIKVQLLQVINTFAGSEGSADDETLVIIKRKLPE